MCFGGMFSARIEKRGGDGKGMIGYLWGEIKDCIGRDFFVFPFKGMTLYVYMYVKDTSRIADVGLPCGGEI